MSKKKIIIQTASLEKAGKEFIAAWRQAEAGHTPKAPIEKISFEDARLLFKTLTPKRFELLNYIHEQGKISIRALAKALNRDYSNVHQDIKTLYQIGLVIKDDEDNLYLVPWDVIVTEIPLTITKHSSHSKRQSQRVAHG